MTTGIINQAMDRIADVLGCYGYASNVPNAITLTTSAQKLTLNQFTGSGCSLSSNGIKVEKAGIYEISGTAYFTTGFTVNDVMHMLLIKNSTTVVDNGKRAYAAAPYENIYVSPTIINLAAGDVIYVHVYNQTGARGTVGTGSQRNYLKVNRIA